MRIQAFAERSGISRRNIHFYIQEGLIHPKTDKSNGYYDFSEQDLEQLTLVKYLREAGFSVATIRSLFQTPAATEYYLRIRLGRMEQERKQMLQTEQNLKNLLEQLPMHPDFSQLGKMVARSLNKKAEIEPLYDGFLVNHFLWRLFWPQGQLTEYQQFLWEKINRMTDSREKNADYAKVYDYLCSEEQKKIDALYADRNDHYNYVAGLTEEEILLYTEEMKERIWRFARNSGAVRQWKQNMKNVHQPMMKIYTSEIGRIAEEMCPLFREYKRKSQAACKKMYDWLHTPEGGILLELLEDKLKGFINLEHCSHAELESMNMEMMRTAPASTLSTH